MGKILIPACYRNVQLSEKEQVVVFISTETNRILGFGHRSMRMNFAEGFKTEELLHAADIERYAERYRRQEAEDAELADYKQTMREKPARDAIRAALVARRSHVDGPNRAYIDANLKLMDQREQRALKRERQSYLLAEKYEAGTDDHDIALDAPIFRALKEQQ